MEMPDRAERGKSQSEGLWAAQLPAALAPVRRCPSSPLMTEACQVCGSILRPSVHPTLL